MLEIVTPPSASSLVEVSALSSLLAAGAASEDVSRFVRLASDEIARHVGAPAGEAGFSLGLQQLRVTLPGDGSLSLFLPGGPIVGTPMVLRDGEPVTDFVVEDRAGGELYLESGWGWSVQYGGRFERRPIPGTERNNIEVTWWTGYALPGVADLPEGAPEGAPPLPAAIEMAAQVTTRDWFLESQRDPSVTTRNIPQGEDGSAYVQYTTSPAERRNLPPHALALLRPFRWRKA